MIEKLHIVDFQSHKDTLLEFSPGYNAIVGPSGVGKSSSLRALRFLVFNQPRGDFFIRRPDGVNATVEASINGHIVKRIKGQLNEYYLDETKWSDFGTQIPQPIVDAIGIHSIKSDADTEFNLQFAYQFDGPFLLSESESVKAKFLNRLSGTHILDIVLKELISDVREVSNSVTLKESEKAVLEADLQKYNKVDAFKSSLKYIAERLKCLMDLEKQIERLQKLEYAVNAWKQSYDRITKVQFALQSINIGGILATIERHRRLQDLQGRYTNLVNRQEIAGKSQSLLGQIDKQGAINRIGQLETFRKIKTNSDKIEFLISNIEAQIKKAHNDFENLQQTYITELKTLQICPTCGQSTLQLK